MKIVFFGTPDYVLPVAETLFKEFHTAKEKGVVAVVTQPPKPAGRTKHMEYSPVDKWAYKRKIDILYDFQNIPGADMGVVAAYGRIIPKAAIAHFPNGILNIHPSLLPKYRGASPTQAAIAAGETITGVTVIKMDEKMDHGPVISTFKEEISDEDTNETLRARLFDRSAQFLIDLIPNYLNGKVKPKEQNHAEANFTKLIKKEDGFVPPEVLSQAINAQPPKAEWSINFIADYKVLPAAGAIDRFIRAMNPWPMAWTTVSISGETKRLKLIKAHAWEQKLVLETVQLEGKNPVSWDEFQKGYPEASLG